MRCQMSSALLLAAVVLNSAVSAADNSLSEAEKKDGWQLLFNGKDLTGWKCNNDKPINTKVEEGSDRALQIGRLPRHS